MGLAIAKAILRAHGGGIEVRSSAGKGTSFLFWLPANLDSLPAPG
jgi:signal transduction histidine kinase